MKISIKRIVLVGILGIFVLGALDPRPTHASGFAVKEGETAPDFTLHDQNNEAIQLSSLRGQWVVLYFYPKDDTPGCTKEACSFRDNITAIQRLKAKVIGVSVDSVASHKHFSDKHNLNFKILADDQHVVTKKYGTLTRFRGMLIARRSTVIIDPEGIIRKLFPSVRPKNHALEIHKTLLALKAK